MCNTLHTVNSFSSSYIVAFIDSEPTPVFASLAAKIMFDNQTKPLIWLNI